jgi:hypothetical protein
VIGIVLITSSNISIACHNPIRNQRLSHEQIHNTLIAALRKRVPRKEAGNGAQFPHRINGRVEKSFDT